MNRKSSWLLQNHKQIGFSTSQQRSYLLIHIADTIIISFLKAKIKKNAKL